MRVLCAGLGAVGLVDCASRPTTQSVDESVLSVSSASTPTTGPVIADVNTSYPDLLDFMISDVCLDGAGNPTAEDPAMCTGPRRNLRIGEAFPYLTHITSFPIRGPGGRTFVAVFQDTAASAIHNAATSRREYIVSNGSNDALEALSIDAPNNGVANHSSIVFTQAGIAYSGVDPNACANNQPTGTWLPPNYWRNNDRGSYGIHYCDTYEGWYQIPFDLTSGGTVFQRPYAYAPSTLSAYPVCNPNVVSAGNVTADWWDPAQTKFDFGNNVPLEFITVRNWDTNSPPNGNESYFYTREYGYTRHEGWSREIDMNFRGGGCWDPTGGTDHKGAPRPECSEPGNTTKGFSGPYVMSAFGVNYWRLSIENAWVDHEPAVPPLHPYVLPLPADIRADNNLLATGDWVRPHDLNTNPGDYCLSYGGGPATYPWGKSDAWGGSHTNWSWKVIRPGPYDSSSNPSPLNNNRIQFSCVGACNSNVIANPDPALFATSNTDYGGSLASIAAGAKTVQFGAVVKSSPGAVGALVLRMYDRNRNNPAQWVYGQYVYGDGQDHLVEFHFDYTFSGTTADPRWVSLQFTPATAGAQYELDEAYAVMFDR